MATLPEPLEPCEDSAQTVDCPTIRSRMEMLLDLQRMSTNFPEESTPESKHLLEECISDVESFRQSVEQIHLEVPDLDSLRFGDMDAYLEHMKKELDLTEAEKLKICNEIEVHNRIFVEDSTQLERDLKGLKDSLKFMDPQERDNLRDGVSIGCSAAGENQGNYVNELENYNFEILELDHWIEKTKIAARSLLDLDSAIKRFDAIGQIEDILCNVKVIEFEDNCIRVSLKTCISTTGGLLCRKKIDCGIDPSIVDHELLIEVFAGTMEIKDVEIFPDDILIGDIVDAAKAMRQLFYPLLLPNMKSPLEWLVREVQKRIFLRTHRRLVSKDSNRSR